MKLGLKKWPKKDAHHLPFLGGLVSLSLLYLIFLWFFPEVTDSSLRNKMIEAAREMARAEEMIKECRLEAGLALNPAEDPNLTGLIGVRYSMITTSLGNLEAKRTTTNPNLAALLVYFFHQLDLQPGEAVAVGASASFPAALVATMAATKVMGLRPLVIFSLGASQWGANIPQFTLAHMYQCLLRNGFINEEPLAVTLGGEKDVGLDLAPEGRELLLRQIKEEGWSSFQEPSLAVNVARRLALYQKAAGSWEKVGVFVNIGGSYANLGSDALVLSLKPGLNKETFSSPTSKAGVIQAMAARQIPVIHLLYFKGLCSKYRLEWDPVPLPDPGKSLIFQVLHLKEKWFLYLNLVYLSLFLIWWGMSKYILSSFK